MDQSNEDRPHGREPFPPQPDREATGPTASEPRTAHELRYDGPITIDDDEPIEDDPGRGSTRRTAIAFFAVSFVVVVLLGVALLMRDEGNADDVTTLLAQAPAGQQVEPPAAPMPEETTAEPGGLAPAATEPIPEDPSAWRPVPAPEAPSAPAVQPEVERAPAERPAPRAAAQYVEPPSESRRAANEAPPSGLAALARRSRQRALAAPAGSWTLQVLFACEPANARRAVERAGGDDLFVFAVEHDGRRCYRLSWGVYPDRQRAEGAIAQVPRYFREASRPRPVVLARAAGL